MLIMCNVIMILYDAAVEISSCSVRKLVDPPSKLLYTASGKSGIRNKESNTPKENTEFSGSLSSYESRCILPSILHIQPLKPPTHLLPC